MTACLNSVFFALVLAAPAQENLLVNGDFEQGLAGWSDLWTRTPGGKLSLDRQQRHGGTQALRIEYTGQRDWSLGQQRSLEVKPEQIYELSGWVRVQGRGDTTLCVTLRDTGGNITEWVFAGQTAARYGGLAVVAVSVYRAARRQDLAAAFDRQWPGDRLVRRCGPGAPRQRGPDAEQGTCPRRCTREPVPGCCSADCRWHPECHRSSFRAALDAVAPQPDRRAGRQGRRGPAST